MMMMRDASPLSLSPVLRLVLVLAAGLWGPAAAHAAVVPEIPSELKTAVSADLRRIEAAGANGYRGLNPENRMTLNFDGRSLQVAPVGKDESWHWGLELAGYGTPGHLQPVLPAQVAVSGQRLEYRRGEVTEWYENRPEGLEQGFTLARPPVAGAPEIELRLSASGGLKAEIEAGGRSAKLSDPSGRVVLAYRDLSVADAKGKALPAQMTLAGESLAIRVDVRGAAWPIVVDPLIVSEQAKLTASDRNAQDYFGFSVAVSGDTAVVGAPGADGPGVPGLPDVGAAYVYVRIAGGTTWTQQAKLTASDWTPSDYFGTSVAVGGDTVVVGAPAAEVLSECCVGAAYVFVKPAGGWTNATETAKLTASDWIQNSDFGRSVAVSGDTVLVGAPVGSAGYGAGYVYSKPPGGWTSGTETAKLTGTDSVVDDRFGFSVALSGETAVVGAPYAILGGTQSWNGAAYVYVKPAGGWVDTTEQARLRASDGDTGDSFGWSVATAENTIVAGAPYADTSAADDSGAAYVFAKPLGGWSSGTETAKLAASDGQPFDLLGWSVGAWGDTVLAGAIYAHVAAEVKGAAYLYTRPAGGWTNGTEAARLTASDGGQYDNFGSAVSVSGATAVVGASYASGGIAALQAGAAYVYVRPQHTLTVTKAGTGTGKVTSDPAGIDCGGVCQVSYPKDTVVTLTAQPSPGSIFLGWGSSCGYQGVGAPVLPLNQCQVKLNKAKTVKAKFVKVLP